MYGTKAIQGPTELETSIATIQKLSKTHNGFWEVWIECHSNLLTNFNRVSDRLAIEPTPCRKVVIVKACFLYVGIRSKSVLCKKVNLVHIFDWNVSQSWYQYCKYTNWCWSLGVRELTTNKRECKACLEWANQWCNKQLFTDLVSISFKYICIMLNPSHTAPGQLWMNPTSKCPTLS